MPKGESSYIRGPTDYEMQGVDAGAEVMGSPEGRRERGPGSPSPGCQAGAPTGEYPPGSAAALQPKLPSFALAEGKQAVTVPGGFPGTEEGVASASRLERSKEIERNFAAAIPYSPLV